MSYALLIASVSTDAFLFEFPASGAGYDVGGLGQTTSPFLTFPPDTTGYVCPLADNGNFALYAKHVSGRIDKFTRSGDSDKWSNVSGPVFFGAPLNGFGCANFLMTDGGKTLIAQAPSLSGDIVKVTVQGTPHIAPFISNADGSIGRARVMRWAPNGDLCLLIDYGNGIFPESQAIVRFDPKSGVPKGDLVPRGGPHQSELVFAVDFEFGPDGNIYTCNLLSGIVTFDGTTGQRIGTFRSPAQLPYGLGTLQRTPDDKLLYHVAQGVTAFDASGSDKHSFPLTYPGLSRCTFLTTVRTATDAPWMPHYALLTQVLAGLLADNPGWKIPPGGVPGPDPGWQRMTSQIWAGLTAEEQDVLVAYGIHEMSKLLKEKQATATIQNATRRALGKTLTTRLENLVRLNGLAH
jgi:hypothetical protein